MAVDMTVEARTDGALVRAWRATLRCDWPGCDSFTELQGFAYPAEVIGPEGMAKRAGWFSPAPGRHLCLSTEEEIFEWLADRERKQERELDAWFHDRT